MATDSIASEICVGLVGLVAGLTIGFSALSDVQKQMKELRQQAVEQNYAEYDRGTGEWRWISDVEVKQ